MDNIDVGYTYIDHNKGDLAAEIDAAIKFKINFAELGKVLAHANSEQQAEFLDSFITHLKTECGPRIAFQHHAIAEYLDGPAADQAVAVLEGLIEYLKDDEIVGKKVAA